MSMTLFNAQNAIKERISAIPNSLGRVVQVYEGAVDDTEMAKYVEEEGLEPFIVINYSTPSQAPRRMHNMTGALDNTVEAQAIVQAVADSSHNARRVWAEFNKRLNGFAPPNCGELQPALFMATGGTNFLAAPTRYNIVQSYVFYVNSDRDTDSVI